MNDTLEQLTKKVKDLLKEIRNRKFSPDGKITVLSDIACICDDWVSEIEDLDYSEDEDDLEDEDEV